MSISNSIESPKTPFMSDSDFNEIVSRFKVLSGIQIDSHKKSMVKRRILARIEATKSHGFPEYLTLLDDPKWENENEKFCNALTTNLTSFFREMHHFSHLKANIEETKNLSDGRIRGWSAGCSTGEEAYSIVVTMIQSLDSGSISRAKILATDIDTEVLEIGRQGVFNRTDLVGFPSGSVNKKIIMLDDQRFSFDDEVKNLISFKQLNLLEPWPIKQPFDFIFCRNVLIYFSSEKKAALIERLAQQLRPGGFLYLGHSETIIGNHALLENIGQTIYRKRL